MLCLMSACESTFALQRATFSAFDYTFSILFRNYMEVHFQATVGRKPLRYFLPLPELSLSCDDTRLESLLSLQRLASTLKQKSNCRA